MKRTLAVLTMVGALFFSAPLSAQAKPDWSKVKPETAAPATNVPVPANDKGAANDDAPTAQAKPVPVPQKPAVQEAPTDLSFPKLTGRVVDQAGLLSVEQVADLTAKSDALEKATGRQFVVATVTSLNGHTIEDYGYQLGRAWGIGQEKKDDGVILLVAPNQREVRIETGYGARVFLTDAVSSVIINENILPAFRNGDMGGGVTAGADQIISMMQLPPADAAKRAQEIGAAEAQRKQEEQPSLMEVIVWIFFIIFIFLLIRRLITRGGGRRYRSDYGGPVILWGPGSGSSGWGSGGSDWGGGGGGFGGFSGGGGSFGGGGASGSW